MTKSDWRSINSIGPENIVLEDSGVSRCILGIAVKTCGPDGIWGVVRQGRIVCGQISG